MAWASAPGTRADQASCDDRYGVDAGVGPRGKQRQQNDIQPKSQLAHDRARIRHGREAREGTNGEPRDSGAYRWSPQKQQPSRRVAYPLARHPQEQRDPQSRLLGHQRQDYHYACRRDGGGQGLVGSARAKPAEAAGHCGLQRPDDQRRRAERKDPGVHRSPEQVQMGADHGLDEECDGSADAAEGDRQPQGTLEPKRAPSDMSRRGHAAAEERDDGDDTNGGDRCSVLAPPRRPQESRRHDRANSRAEDAKYLSCGGVAGVADQGAAHPGAPQRAQARPLCGVPVRHRNLSARPAGAEHAEAALDGRPAHRN